MNTEHFRSVATRVSAVGMAGNVALTLFKLAAGILGRSRAMISDAVHSAALDDRAGGAGVGGSRTSLASRECDREKQRRRLRGCFEPRR